MATTTITLANGREVAVKGDYADVRTMLQARQLTADDGLRELTTLEGQRLTINIGGILAVEERTATTERTVGFA